MKWLVDVEQWVQQSATIEIEASDRANAIYEARWRAENGGVAWRTNLARSKGWAASDARLSDGEVT